MTTHTLSWLIPDLGLVAAAVLCIAVGIWQDRRR
jgi:hypothetical protein